MQKKNVKQKGKNFETKVADKIHDSLYQNNEEYKKLFDQIGSAQLKPKRDSSSGTFNTSTSDIELGLALRYFPYSIECKHNKLLDMNLNSFATSKIKIIINMWEQCLLGTRKANALSAKGPNPVVLTPLLVFRGNRTEDYCMVESEVLKDSLFNFKLTFLYNDISYSIVLFDDFLSNKY